MHVTFKVEEKKSLFIIFCLPGSNFTGHFLDSFIELMEYCHQKGIQFKLSRQYSPVIYYVRNLCLGGSVLRGINQKPFNNQFNYTHIMWIDSDIVFTPEQFQALLDHDKDIVSGLYLMGNNKHLATVKTWDENYFKNHGSFQFLTLKDIEGKRDLIDVAYTGLGFILIKKGVFESLTYPWFQPIFYNLGENIMDFSSEDVSFCRRIIEKGFKIYVDPKIQVGHEKSIIL